MSAARTQHKERVPTRGKLERDAENIRRYARFIIRLDEMGRVSVLDNGCLRIQGRPFAKIIAVLGPIHYQEELLSESILLEVGYGRTRPYAQIEKRTPRKEGGERIWCIKARAYVRELSDAQWRRVYPYLVQCMELVVTETYATWATRGEPWCIYNDSFAIPRGVHFTVSRKDEPLYTQLLVEDVRNKVERYVSDHARFVADWLSVYARAHYSERQLRSFKNVQKVVGLLTQEHYTPFTRALLRMRLPNERNARSLFDEVVEVYGIDCGVSASEQVLMTQLPPLPPFFHIRCYMPQQPTVHAKGMNVFELFLKGGLDEYTRYNEGARCGAPF